MEIVKYTLCTIIFLCMQWSSHGQSRWTHFYFGNEDTWGRDVVEDYDNGYLMTGQYGSGYDHYAWLLKTDINGEVLWQKTFGDPNSIISYYSMDVNTSGDIYLSGQTSYYDTYRDPLIMKLNNCGEKEWCRVFNSTEHFDEANSIVATSDGGCAVMLRYTGISYQTDRICMARFNANGILLWKHCYNSSDSNLMNEDFRDLINTPDKGFLITATCGYLDTISTNLYWPKQYYIKTDSLGNLEWEKVMFADDYLSGGDAWTTCMNPDSTYYYSSVSHYFFESNFSSPALIKLDLDGNIIAVYDIVNSYINGGLTYAQFINDSTLIASCVYGNTQDDIVTLATKLDTLGNILDSLDLGPHIREKVIRVTTDSMLLFFYNVLQNDQLDVYLRKLNYNLEDDTLYTRPYTYDSLCPYQIVSDTIVPDDCGLIVGVEEDGKTIGREDGKTGGLELWPNPCTGMLNVECLMLNGCEDCSLEVYDIFGRELFSLPPGRGRAGDGGRSWQINVETLPPGVYVAILKKGYDIVNSRKFVVAR